MGKKNKKGGDPKENKNPNKEDGASGGKEPAKEKKDSGESSSQQGGKVKKQPQGARGPQEQGQGQSHQQPQQGGQQQQGARAPQQQGQGQGPQQRPQGGQQQQGAWSQQSQGARGPQQQGQGQGQQQRSQGGQQQQGAWSQQSQGARGPQQQGQGQGQQQRPQGGQQQQGAWSQQSQGARGPQQQGQGQGQQQRPQGGQQQQGAWSQQSQGARGPQQQGQGQGQQQRPQGGQQQQGAWSQQSQGARGPQQQGQGQGQQQRPQGGQQQQGAWSQQSQGARGPQQQGQGQGQQQRPQGPHQGQGQGYQQRSQQQEGAWTPRGSGQQRQGDRPPSQGSQGSWSQQGPRQQQGGRQQPVQEQSTVQLVPSHPNSPARGTKGFQFYLDTNYLTLNLDKMPDVAYHYDVKIDPDRPKKFMRPAFDQYVAKVFPDRHFAYDGKANAYTVQKLSEDVLNANQDVEVKVIEGIREVSFKVTVKPTDDVEIDLKSLKTYHNDRIFDKPMRALQCIEVVLSSPCHEKGVRAGRSFFTPPPQQYDLGDGFELWFGLYQAAMLCDQPLLNVDVSHKSFPTEVKLDRYYEGLRRPSPKALEDFLKGLRVLYTPPKIFNATAKEFKFLKVMDSSSKETFKLEDGTRQTVAQYFQSKGAPLQKPNLPCLHIGSSIKTNYVPLEFLTVPPGQAVMRKDNENQVRQMIRFAATSTGERKEKIMRLLEHFNYNMHPTVERFGLFVGNQFINVPARLLESPKIEYAAKRSITIDRPGEWMMRGVSFLSCDRKILHKWAIINISKKPEISELFLKENFVSQVVQMSSKVGMSLDNKCFQIREPKMTGYRISIKEDLKALKAAGVSIVFVILPYASEAYAQVKQEAELSCGIVTQCIKGDTMRSENRRGTQIINSMTVGNILLKVNAKLNGSNHKIAEPNEIQLQKTSKVMFVGADVSHPSPLQKNLPSIVGVVASHDLYGTKYNMQYRLQSPGVETIVDMKDIFTQHLNMYKAQTGFLPDNIIYYRDGVSDGQFQLIDKIELSAMRAACKMMKCNAKFTCIIVVKRHHTRFFPKREDSEGKFDNVKAGTVVDRHIIHPMEVQFFMVSHKSIQGTAKPTRYNVIVDDAKINIDDLQAMTYNLCHLFPRCNRSVSYPAPAYLAHLVGLRGRAYIEGPNLKLENLKGEYAKRLVSNDVMQKNPMFFV